MIAFRNMFRNILRKKYLTFNVIQIFLTRNQYILNRLYESSLLLSCAPQKLNYLQIYSNLNRRILDKKSPSNFFLFSGILTFLGLKQEGEEESELIMTIKKGILCIKRGQFEKAELTLHNALKMAHEEPNEDGITYIYDVLANLALDAGQNEKAEKLFLNVMQRLLNNGYEADDDKIIHISLKLAKIYELNKDIVKAYVGYQYCLSNLEKKITTSGGEEENNEDTLKLWITTLDTYARFLISQNKTEEAVSYYNKALDMCIQVNGKNHEDTALLLSDLGTAMNIMGDIDSAVSYTQEALEIGKSVDKMEHLPVIYINLGYLYLMKEMYNESKEACEKGIFFARRDEDDDSINKGKECLKKIKEILKNNGNQK